MIKRPYRVPRPVSVGNVDVQSLAELNLHVPLDCRTEISHPPLRLLRDFPDDFPPDFYERLRPMSELAIGNHIDVLGVNPQRARLVVTNIGVKQGTANKWHCDPLLPGESLYFTAADRPPEFVEGEGIPGINYVPNVALNGLTNRLIGRGQLQTVPVQAGEVLGIGGDNIHRRRLDLPDEGRISATLYLSHGQVGLPQIIIPT